MYSVRHIVYGLQCAIYIVYCSYGTIFITYIAHACACVHYIIVTIYNYAAVPLYSEVINAGLATKHYVSYFGI